MTAAGYGEQDLGGRGLGERDLGERDLNIGERDLSYGRRDAGLEFGADDGIVRDPERPVEGNPGSGSDDGAELVPPETRAGFESRWREIQAMFVDEPREAVGRANGLLDEVVRSVMAGFSERTAALEQRPEAQANTEQLRQALRSYRVLFDRVLRI